MNSKSKGSKRFVVFELSDDDGAGEVENMELPASMAALIDLTNDQDESGGDIETFD